VIIHLLNIVFLIKHSLIVTDFKHIMLRGQKINWSWCS